MPTPRLRQPEQRRRRREDALRERPSPRITSPLRGGPEADTTLRGARGRRATEGIRARPEVRLGERARRQGTTAQRGLGAAIAGQAGSFSALRADEAQAEAEQARTRGDEARARRLEQEAEREMDRAEDVLRRAEIGAPDVRSVRDLEGVGDAFDLASGIIGGLPASIGPTAAAGAGGFLAGGPGAGMAAAGGMAWQQERARAALEQRMDPDVAERPAEERLAEGRRAATFAAPLQTVAPGLVMRGLQNRRLLQTPGRHIAATGAAEATAEAGADLTQQHSLQRLGSERDIDPIQTADAALQGVFGGAAMAGVPAATGRVLGLAEQGLERATPVVRRGAERLARFQAERTPVPTATQDTPSTTQRQQLRQQRFEASVREQPEATPAQRLRATLTDPADTALDGVALGTDHPALRQQLQGLPDEQAQQLLTEWEGDQQMATQQMAEALGMDATEMDLADPAQQLDIARAFQQARQAQNVEQSLGALEGRQQRDDGGIQLAATTPADDRAAFIRAAEPLLRPTARRNPQVMENLDRAVGQILQLSMRPLDARSVDDAAPIIQLLDTLFEDPASAVQQLQENFQARLPEDVDQQASVLGRLLQTPRATNDARRPDSFLHTMLDPQVRAQLTPRQLRRLGQAIDDAALEDARQDLTVQDPEAAPQGELGPEGVIRALSQAFGTPERAQLVLDYYRLRPEATTEGAQTALQQIEAEADQQVLGHEGRASVGFEPGTSPAQAQEAAVDSAEATDAQITEGLEEMDLGTERILFQDDRARRPWFRGDRDVSAAAEAAAQLQEQGESSARVATMEEAVLLQGLDAHEEAQRLGQDLRTRRDEHVRRLAREYGLRGEGAVELALEKVQAGEPPADPASARWRNARTLHEQLVQARQAHREAGSQGVLALFDTVHIPGAAQAEGQSQASSFQLRRWSRRPRQEDPRGLPAQQEEQVRLRNARIRDTRVAFERTDGSTFSLYSEAMITERGQQGDDPGGQGLERRRRLFSEAVAMVLARPEVNGTRTEVSQVVVDRGTGERFEPGPPDPARFKQIRAERKRRERIRKRAQQLKNIGLDGLTPGERTWIQAVQDGSFEARIEHPSQRIDALEREALALEDTLEQSPNDIVRQSRINALSIVVDALQRARRAIEPIPDVDPRPELFAEGRGETSDLFANDVQQEVRLHQLDQALDAIDSHMEKAQTYAEEVRLEQQRERMLDAQAQRAAPELSVRIRELGQRIEQLRQAVRNQEGTVDQRMVWEVQYQHLQGTREWLRQAQREEVVFRGQPRYYDEDTGLGLMNDQLGTGRTAPAIGVGRSSVQPRPQGRTPTPTELLRRQREFEEERRSLQEQLQATLDDDAQVAALQQELANTTDPEQRQQLREQLHVRARDVAPELAQQADALNQRVNELRAQYREAWTRANAVGSQFSSLNPRHEAPRRLNLREQRQIIEDVRRMRGPDVEVAFADLLGVSGRYTLSQGQQNRLIEVALAATNPRSVAWHEALHDFVASIDDTQPAEANIKQRLLRAASQPAVMRQLNELLANEPAAREAIRRDTEERAAFMFQFWMEGQLELSTEPQSLLGQVWQFLQRVLGIVSEHQQVDTLLTALSQGQFAHVRPRRLLRDVKKNLRAEARQEDSPVTRVLIEHSAQTGTEKLRRLTGPVGELAHKLAFGGATNRLLNTGIPELQQIADMFHTDPTREDQAPLGFLQSQVQRSSKFRNRLFNEILANTTKEQRMEAMQELQNMASEPRTQLARNIRAFLRDMHSYMHQAGVQQRHGRDGQGNPIWRPINQVPKYFPRMWDPKRIRQDREAFAALLREESSMSEDAIQTAIQGIESSLGVDHGMAESTNHVGLNPFMQGVNPRAFDFITEQNAHRFQQFQHQDLTFILNTYIQQATYRAEYAQRFGNDGEVIDHLLNQAEARGVDPAQVQDARKTIKAMQGTLAGEKMPASLRKAQVGMLTYQSVLLLPASLFAQIVDVLGIGLRSGELHHSWRAFNDGLSQLRQSIQAKIARRELPPDENEELARTLGIVDEENMLQAMGQAYTGMEMGRVIQTVNRNFFRYNGMELWQRRMRITAMVVGERFILRNQNHSRYMQELRLSPRHIYQRRGDEQRLALTFEDILDAMEAENFVSRRTGQVMDQEEAQQEARAVEQQVHAAMFRFVDGAVTRPNAAHRPVWGSDSRFLLLFHLKQFAYSFHNVILKRTGRELEHGNTQAGWVLASYVPFMFATDIARLALTGTGPRYDRMDTYDQFLTAVSRSNAMGVGVFGAEAVSDPASGRIPGQSLLGPSFQHASLLVEGALGNASAEQVMNRSVPFMRLIP